MRNLFSLIIVCFVFTTCDSNAQVVEGKVYYEPYLACNGDTLKEIIFYNDSLESVFMYNEHYVLDFEEGLKLFSKDWKAKDSIEVTDNVDLVLFRLYYTDKMYILECVIYDNETLAFTSFSKAKKHILELLIRFREADVLWNE